MHLLIVYLPSVFFFLFLFVLHFLSSAGVGFLSLLFTTTIRALPFVVTEIRQPFIPSSTLV